MAMDIKITDWQDKDNTNYTKKVPNIKEPVRSLSVSVDNGRFYIAVNGKEVFSHHSLLDGCVDITFE